MKPADSTIVIRHMNAVDLQRGFLETVRALRPTDLTLDQAVAVFRRRMRNKVRTFVALIDGKVVGTASLLIEPKFIHDGGVTGHVEDVAVHPECQGKGIGALLVERILEESRKEGCYKVILDCAEKVMPFYEKLGFSKWERAMRIDLEVQ
jgi:glucosamine-phosphate N-acetyltransferase